jgi:hypothetical protein
MRPGRAVALAALAAGLAPALASAAPALLPSPTSPLDAKVPLGAGGGTVTATRLPLNATVRSRQRVVADVTPAGDVVRIRVRQVLTIRGLGDFFFTVPAPLRDVRAAPGSQSQPGLRPKAIVWQGFSPGRRVVAADAVLVPRAAAPSLPLHLRLEATVDAGRLRVTLRLANTTGVRAQGFSARVDPKEVARVVDAIAAAVRRGVTPAQAVVQAKGPVRPRTFAVSAPLLVRGEVRVPASGAAGVAAAGGTVERRPGLLVLRFRTALGGPEPRVATVSLTATARRVGKPSASVTARPEPLLPELRDSRRPKDLGLAMLALLRLARVHQYESFLGGPPTVDSETAYSFRTVAPRARPGAPASDGGRSTAVALAIGLGAALGVAGLVVLWAHS